ncbi:MAG: hypothetical protein LBC88_07100 [Spirochaetaceae bacterium]|jgi:hypothetical protein|nr:hypothetical protein [Spirochaetaceae bacterium]
MRRLSATALCAALLFAAARFPAAAQSPDFPPPGAVSTGITNNGDTSIGDGETAIAARYRSWVEAALAQGRLEAAEIALERANDYAAVSSDLSYLLARVRLDCRRPARPVLEAARRGIETRRWDRYREEDARLIEAEILIRLRRWDGALESLARIHGAAATREAYGGGQSVAEAGAVLRLKALLGKGDLAAFRREAGDALAKYPRNPEVVRVFFSYASGNPVDTKDTDLMLTALSHLPFLVDRDADLAWRGASFIRDTETARRYLTAYRAGGGKQPGAIPVALNFGLIGEEAAVTELFANREEAVDIAVFRAVFGLLRHEEGRERFRRNLERFSGVISEDGDRDEYAEAWTTYRNGEIHAFTLDRNQDGEADWEISFSTGTPVSARAEFAVDDETGADGRAEIFWEVFPWVREVRLGGTVYRYKPLDFALPLLEFSVVVAGAEPLPSSPEPVLPVLYPAARRGQGLLSRRALIMAAESLERQSREFPGGVERIQLSGGIPLIGAEMARGRIASVTEYQSGRKRLQRLDLDLDGRMETVRRFRRKSAAEAGRESPLLPETEAILESSESDWDGDGVFETGEEYYPDGTVRRSWDFNRDGTREYAETNRE